MADTIRLNKVLRELNISLDRVVEFLDSKGIEIEKRPTTKISEEVHQLLYDEFETDANKKARSQKVSEAKLKEKEALREERERELEEKQKKEEAKQAEVVKAKTTLSGPKQIGKITTTKISEEVHQLLYDEFETDANKKARSQKVSEAKLKEKEALREERERELEEKQKKEEAKQAEVVKAKTTLSGPKQIGKIELEPKAKKAEQAKEEAPKKAEEKSKTDEKPRKEDKPKEKNTKEETPAKTEKETEPVEEKLTTQYQKLSGPKIAGDKIDLSQFKKPKKKEAEKPKEDASSKNKKKRRRISKGGADTTSNQTQKGNGKFDKFKGKRPDKRQTVKEEPSEEEVQKQIRE